MQEQEPFVLDITLDPKSSTALHAQITAPLQRLIESGELEPGRRLEDEVSMAKRLKVSRPTARRALETLANRGLIIRRRGAGTQVTPRQVHRPLALTSLNDDLRRAGHEPRTSVLLWEQEPAAPGISAALGLEDGAPVIHIKRLRLSNDQPIAILTNYISPELAPSAEELKERGFYELLREKGADIAFGTQKIGARLATTDEARLLNEPPASALLTMERTAYSVNHQPVEFGLHAYRASMYSYSQAVTT